MRHRKRILRQAIDKYLDWVNWHKLHCRNIRAANMIRYKYDMKLLQTCMNGLCYYKNRNKLAHRYWSKILHKLDAYHKTRTMQIWRENAGFKHEDKLEKIQDSVTDAIYRRN